MVDSIGGVDTGTVDGSVTGADPVVVVNPVVVSAAIVVGFVTMVDSAAVVDSVVVDSAAVLDFVVVLIHVVVCGSVTVVDSVLVADTVTVVGFGVSVVVEGFGVVSNGQWQIHGFVIGFGVVVVWIVGFGVVVMWIVGLVDCKIMLSRSLAKFVDIPMKVYRLVQELGVI